MNEEKLNMDKNKGDRASAAGKLMSWGACLGMASLPLTALAQSEGFGDTKESMCGFLGNITSLLSIGSIAVVTIAIIFAGYQIAFAHKRISEVAPILIGALLIGAAGQIATMIIGDGGDSCSTAMRQAASALYQYA